MIMMPADPRIAQPFSPRTRAKRAKPNTRAVKKIKIGDGNNGSNITVRFIARADLAKQVRGPDHFCSYP